MKVSLQGEYQLASIKWPDSIKEKLLKLSREHSLNHIWFAAPQPIKQGGQMFAFIVLPVEVTPELDLKQAGQGVLCQTEAEAKETFTQLSERMKDHLVSFQMPGFGSVGFVTNIRRLIREISARSQTSPNDNKVWVALERDIDQTTGGSTVIRCEEVANQEEAERLAKQWQSEWEQKKKQAAVAMAKDVTPVPPSRCEPLTKFDMEDLAKAKLEVLRRQWPNCFKVFDGHKNEAKSGLSENETKEAYLLDIAEQGGDPKAVQDTCRLDMSFIRALVKAASRGKKSKRKHLLQLVDFLIAFNWELGWCYLPGKELAEKISAIVKTPFKPGQIKKRRERLGLVAKHLTGPKQKSS